MGIVGHPDSFVTEPRAVGVLSADSGYFMGYEGNIRPITISSLLAAAWWERHWLWPAPALPNSFSLAVIEAVELQPQDMHCGTGPIQPSYDGRSSALSAGTR